MKRKISGIKQQIVKTGLILALMLLPGVGLDIVYWESKRWVSWWGVSFLWHHNITYSGAFAILGGNFGVILTMVSMFLTINNNISERFEKKVYGVPRAELYSEEKTLYKYLRRLCLCAPILMLLFLNLHFCISGYLVFGYCIFFLLWHYYRHSSSFSKPVDEMIGKLKANLPEKEEWTRYSFSAYQMLLENIGRSVEEDGNWKEIEILYRQLREATQGYDCVKRYLLCYYFYQIVFWRRKGRNQIAPMRMMRAYIEELDMSIGEGGGRIPENQWPVLWGMLRVAVCEAEEDELIRFLQYFYDFPGRSRMVLRKTEKYTLESKMMEEQAGMMLILLEYRLKYRLPEKIQFTEQLRKAWKCGSYFFLSDQYEFFSRIAVFNQNLFEEDGPVLETVIENLRGDYGNYSRQSMIANLISI